MTNFLYFRHATGVVLEIPRITSVDHTLVEELRDAGYSEVFLSDAPDEYVPIEEVALHKHELPDVFINPDEGMFRADGFAFSADDRSIDPTYLRRMARVYLAVAPIVEEYEASRKVVYGDNTRDGIVEEIENDIREATKTNSTETLAEKLYALGYRKAS